MDEMMKHHAKMMGDEEKQESGWQAMLTHILNNIHDRINYGTQTRRDATLDASEEAPEPKKSKGFKAIANEKE